MKATYILFILSSLISGSLQFPAKKPSAISNPCILRNGNTEIDCANIQFIGKSAGVKIKLKTCEVPLRVNFRIIIDVLGIDWSKDIEANQEFPIPGFEYKAFGVGGKVFVRVNLYKKNEQIKVQIILKVELSVSDATVVAPKITVYDDSIDVEENCSEEKWSTLSTGTKAGIIIGVVIGVLLLVVIIVYLARRFSGKCTRKKRWSAKRNQPKDGGGTVMKNVNNYEKKQKEANKTNIKIAGKKGPQKFVPH